MLTRRTLRASTAVASVVLGSAIAIGLTACASAELPLDPSTRPTMAPEQSSAEACAVSQAKVDALVAEVRKQLATAGKTVAAGKTPDLSALVGSLDGSMATIIDEVSNTEVLSALTRMRAEFDGLGEISPPDSILGMPGYLAELGTQFGKVTEAGSELQELCSAG